MALYRDHAVVLRTWKLGEADRIVSLHTHDHGKVRGVAKGVRRTKSKFGARLEPLSHVAVQLYRGKGDLDTITQVVTIEPFHHLRADLDRVVAAGTMVEVADAVAQEDESAVRLFLLLQRGLRALDAGDTHPDLVTAFLLKAAEIVGVAPALDTCAGCGRADHLTRFSFAGGGAQCDRCRSAGAFALQDGLTTYLAGLAVAELSELPPAEPAMTGQAMGVARRFVEYHLERKLESLAVLDG